MRHVFAVCSALLFVVTVDAQTHPAFEVATIKPADPNGLPNLPGGDLPDAVRFRSTTGQIDYRGVTLNMLLQRAYDLTSSQVSGPRWLNAERYDIVGKFPAGATSNDVPAMLQQLLAERFHVALHREMKTLKVYEVTVAKGGPKLTPAQPRRETKTVEDRQAYAKQMLEEMTQRMSAKVAAGETPGQARATNGATLEQFLKLISPAFDRPLKDRTGISGTYDIGIGWASTPTGSPSIFLAFEEQLGLKVQPATEEMEYLVVDSASRTPDAN